MAMSDDSPEMGRPQRLCQILLSNQERSRTPHVPNAEEENKGERTTKGTNKPTKEREKK